MRRWLECLLDASMDPLSPFPETAKSVPLNPPPVLRGGTKLVSASDDKTLRVWRIVCVEG